MSTPKTRRNPHLFTNYIANLNSQRAVRNQGRREGVRALAKPFFSPTQQGRTC